MADLPAGVVTVTSTVPEPAGLSAVIVVLLTTVTFIAPFVPKSTAVAPVKPEPVIVTKLSPAAGPRVGLKPVTVGRWNRLCQHDVVAPAALVSDVERNIVDRQRGPFRETADVPTIGAVLLMIVKASPFAGVKPSERLSVLPARVTVPVTLSWS